MMVDPRFARGALRRWPRYQATEIDDWRDAEPGKIPHELRVGELAHFKRVPHTPYYGTADATPLYLIVLHEAWRWLGDDALLRSYRDVALALPGVDRSLRRPRRRRLPGVPDALRARATRTWAGRTPATPSSTPTAARSSSPRRCASCRATSSTPSCAWPRCSTRWRARPRGRAAPRGRRAAAALRGALLVRGHRAATPSGSIPTSSRSRPSPRTPATACGAASPRPTAPRGSCSGFCEPDMWSGWGIRTLSAREPGLQPVLLPARLGLAARQRHHRARLQALRLRRGGRPRRARHLGGRQLLRRATACPSSTPASSGGPAPFRSCTAAPTSPGLGRRPCFQLLQALLGLRADAPHGRLESTPCSRPGCPMSRCAGCGSATRPWTCASGARASARAGSRRASMVTLKSSSSRGVRGLQRDADRCARSSQDNCATPPLMAGRFSPAPRRQTSTCSIRTWEARDSIERGAPLAARPLSVLDADVRTDGMDHLHAHPIHS